MKYIDALKKIGPIIFANIFITTLVGVLFPYGLVLSGIIIVGLLKRKILRELKGSLKFYDVCFWGIMVLTIGFSIVFVYVIYFSVSNFGFYPSKDIRGIVFLVFYVYLIISLVDWGYYRLPTIIKTRFKK
jgi:hypothetical protein